MLPLRSVRLALSTDRTTPLTTEPAGISTRLPLYRSTTVVASNRSSTCAVSELSCDCSRTSISWPDGITLSPCARGRSGSDEDGRGSEYGGRDVDDPAVPRSLPYGA